MAVKDYGYFGPNYSVNDDIKLPGELGVKKDSTFQAIIDSVGGINYYLDTYVVPNTNLTYTGSDLETTGFTPSTINFNTDALSAMQSLADIVGTREFTLSAP